MAKFKIKGADKVVTIDGVETTINEDIEVTFGANAATLLHYRREFKKDLLKTIMQLQEVYDSRPDGWDEMTQQQKEDWQRKELLTYFDLNMIDELAYVCAKTANPQIEDYVDWLSQFAPFSVMDIGEDIFTLLFKSTVTKINSNGELGKQLA